MMNRALSQTECHALRGIAILMIMLYNFDRHLIPIDGNEMKFGAQYTQLFCLHWYNPLYIVSFTGWTGVCIFLFLSGYGLSLKYCDGKVLGGRELWSFYLHHLTKIAWLSLPLMALYSILNSCMTGQWGITPPGPYWFFPLILECYLVFPLLARLSTRALTLLIATGVAINTLCLYYPLGETTLWYIMRHHIFAWYATFATGIVIARCGKSDTKWYHLLLPVALCASYVVKPLTPLTDVLTALTFCTFAGLFRNRILTWVGRISSSLFLLHAFVRLFLYQWMDCEGMVYMTTALFLVITFAVGWLHHRYMPGNRFSLKKVRAS